MLFGIFFVIDESGFGFFHLLLEDVFELFLKHLQIIRKLAHRLIGLHSYLIDGVLDAPGSFKDFGVNSSCNGLVQLRVETLAHFVKLLLNMLHLVTSKLCRPTVLSWINHLDDLGFRLGPISQFILVLLQGFLDLLFYLSANRLLDVHGRQLLFKMFQQCLHHCLLHL